MDLAAQCLTLIRLGNGYVCMCLKAIKVLHVRTNNVCHYELGHLPILIDTLNSCLYDAHVPPSVCLYGKLHLCECKHCGLGLGLLAYGGDAG